MDFFALLTMLGGLALFLYGMETMGQGLEKLSGGRLERILERLTKSPLKAVLLGAGVTAVIQSSSATTVMVVGFVNSGIMRLSQAVGIIMGANVGTTATSWILSLAGIESGNFFVRLLKPSSFSPVLALIGVLLLMFSKKEKKKSVGTILIGFAILMFGMDTMSGAVKPLAGVPEFTGILTMFSNPLLGILAGALLTAIIQSSSASVGILQALSATGAMNYGSAIPIILGQNIGTCATALLSGIGAGKNARRAALVHLYFNLIGATMFLAAFYTANNMFHFLFLEKPVDAMGIAVVHSLFNVASTLVLLPFSGGLVRLACLSIPDTAEPMSADMEKQKDPEFRLLDERFLETPGYAAEQCRLMAVRMANLSRDCIFTAAGLFKEYNEEQAKEIARMEELADRYEDALGTYMVKLGARSLSAKDSRTVSLLLHCIGDFERISDHGRNLMRAAKEMHGKKLEFSKKAKKELDVLMRAVEECLTLAVEAFEKNDRKRAALVEPLEEVVDGLIICLKANHIKRLQKGKCTIEQGFVLSDISTNLERVSDHCSNIAVSVIEIERDGFDAHGYLEHLKKGNDPQFKALVESYRRKYALPG
ncbi:MAG: Na/Pi cotransporter family protein [Lachnospiraceae bacterium]|nr:Na/Pi cotransporter family protein [Lachnospiraceae bacterium]